jgi:histidinol-phosphate phosphatase family protein
VNAGPRAAARAALFLDRDGTLNREVEGALRCEQQLELLPGAAAAIQLIASAGRACVVLTNQSAIARGWMTHYELERVHAALVERLAREGASIDGILHCPHLDSGGLAPYHRACNCRKPAPGLLLEAASRWDLDLSRSWIIGDALRDLAAGAALGVRGVLVRTGKGAAQAQLAADLPAVSRPAAICADLLEAVQFALDA